MQAARTSLTWSIDIFSLVQYFPYKKQIKKIDWDIIILLTSNIILIVKFLRTVVVRLINYRKRSMNRAFPMRRYSQLGYGGALVLIMFVVLVNKLIKLTFINTEWESHIHTFVLGPTETNNLNSKSPKKHYLPLRQ